MLAGRTAAAGVLIALGALAIASGPSARTGTTRGECGPATAPPAYAHSVRNVLQSGQDIWGSRLLAAPNGPTLAAATRHLPPLLYAVEANGRPATTSGVYYLALTMPLGPYGSRGFALHVADGSEILTRRVDGRHLTVFVGADGGERFGSCAGRRGMAGLAGGYLPILETSYVDGRGVRYRQESFVARLSGTRSLASFLHLTADARSSATGALIRLVPSTGRLRKERVRPGERLDVYAAWINRPRQAPGLDRADRRTYARARAQVVRFWERQLDRGAAFIVPERRALDAERALVIQELSMTWRYSVGNAYEELSFAEALGVAEVMAEYGYEDIARAILRFTLRRLPERYSSFRAGKRLAAGALSNELLHDRAYVREETPGLAAAVSRLGREIDRPRGTGLVGREAVSTDVGTKIYGLHTQTAVWQGLLSMGRVWAQTGYPELAARCRALATRLGAALRVAVERSQRRLPDGSLFVPLALLDGNRPFDRLTRSRDGTYWNLLMPYALASGLFRPHGTQAQGLLRYLLRHGSRLLGLVRSADYKLYELPAFPTSGTDQVYGLSVSRFLADDDQPDQLVLSLYGMLAGSMTSGTFVSGEGATVTPLRGRLDRTMLLPPNSGANAAFLETLRLLLVHETRGVDGRPGGLDLAFATPRGWLEPGKTVRVRHAPTSFGPVSFTIRRMGGGVHVVLVAPAAPSLRLRLRLPAGVRIVAVRLGAHPLRFDARSGTIDLSGRRGRIQFDAAVARRS